MLYGVERDFGEAGEVRGIYIIIVMNDLRYGFYLSLLVFTCLYIVVTIDTFKREIISLNKWLIAIMMVD